MKKHIIARDCRGITLFFHVTEYETHCKIESVKHCKQDIMHVMDPDIIEAAQSEFHHKLINYAP